MRFQVVYDYHQETGGVRSFYARNLDHLERSCPSMSAHELDLPEPAADPYTAGREAFQEGLWLDANPYLLRDDYACWRRWRDGWHDADAH